MAHAEHAELNPAELVLPDPTFAKLRNIFAGTAVLGLVLSIVGFVQSKSSFYFSWLYSYMFWLAMAIGGLMFVLIQHLTRAGWSVTVRRIAEAFASTLMFMPILFLPIIAGMHDLFPWTHEGHISASKAKYLNVPFFLARAALYFTVWIVVSRRFLKASYTQDRSGDPALTGKSQAMAPVGMIITALCMSFAATDWLMSLQPHWYSTIFGVYYFASCMLAVHGGMAIMAVGLRQLPALNKVITVEHMHDIGKFLFGFTVFWAYIGFSQFMLIWYANIPEETEFFLHRFHHGWENVSAMLPLAHFGLAFLILLPRGIKRRGATLVFGALFQLFFTALDIFWIVAPNREGDHATFTLGDAGAFIFIGGVFWLLALRKLKAESLVPYKDPRLAESLVSAN